MPLDSIANNAVAQLSTGINSATTSLTLATGAGSLFPPAATAPYVAYNCILWNSTDYPNPSDDPAKEIVRVTSGLGPTSDTATISRGQDGTTAQNHNTAGKVYKLALAPGFAQWANVAAGLGAFNVDVGIQNAPKVNLAVFPAAAANGQHVRVQMAFTNSDVSTLTVVTPAGTQTALSIKRPGGQALQPGDLAAGMVAVFNLASSGAYYELSNPANLFTIPTYVNVNLAGKYLGSVSVTATITGGICTVTDGSHNYTTGDYVVFTGTVTSGSVNVCAKITVLNVSQYQFSTSASGTVSSLSKIFWFSGTGSLNGTKIQNITRNATGDYTITLTNNQPNAFFGASFSALNSSSSTYVVINTATSPTTNTIRIKVLQQGSTTVQDADVYFSIQFFGVL